MVLVEAKEAGYAVTESLVAGVGGIQLGMRSVCDQLFG